MGAALVAEASRALTVPDGLKGCTRRILPLAHVTLARREPKAFLYVALGFIKQQIPVPSCVSWKEWAGVR
jgi:hypothetical protein